MPLKSILLRCLTLSPKSTLTAALIQAESLHLHWSAQQRDVDRTEFAQAKDAEAFNGEGHFCMPASPKNCRHFFSAGKQRCAHSRYSTNDSTTRFDRQYCVTFAPCIAEIETRIE